jgi:hypothetical protein
MGGGAPRWGTAHRRAHDGAGAHRRHTRLRKPPRRARSCAGRMVPRQHRRRKPCLHALQSVSVQRLDGCHGDSGGRGGSGGLDDGQDDDGRSAGRHAPRGGARTYLESSDREPDHRAGRLRAGSRSRRPADHLRPQPYCGSRRPRWRARRRRCAGADAGRGAAAGRPAEGRVPRDALARTPDAMCPACSPARCGWRYSAST